MNWCADLVGNVGSEVFEDLMGTVARSSSEEALRTLDRLMIEGHNPAHFARQLVRFLRNAVVAKVAGDDSSLLQISSDERARVGAWQASFLKKSWRGFSRSCFAPSMNWDIGRSKDFILSWAC